MACLPRAEQVRKIQEFAFACVDLNLYLDTHPCDKNAVNIFNSLSNQLENSILTYEKNYGPLMNFGHSTSCGSWQWLDDPWPWQKEFYK